MRGGGTKTPPKKLEQKMVFFGGYFIIPVALPPYPKLSQKK